MRGKTRNIVLLMLAFSLLTGSIGMAATQRFCAMLSFGASSASSKETEEMGCCSTKEKLASPEAKTTVDQRDCCSFSTTHQKLDIASTLTFSKIELAAPSPMLVSSFPLPPTAPESTEGVGSFYSDSSPPLAGRDLLHRLHTLLI